MARSPTSRASDWPAEVGIGCGPGELAAADSSGAPKAETFDCGAAPFRVLAELAELGTLRAVATATGYGTSAVSQQLAGLERAARVGLVEPDGRRLRLTPAGRALLPYARQILAAMDAARIELDGGTEPRGTIRVAAYGSALEADLLPVALELRDSHLALRLELYEREPVETVRLVRIAEIELGFIHTYSMVPRAADPMTVSEVLCEVPMVLAVQHSPSDSASPAIPPSIDTPRDLDGLRTTPLIVTSRGHDDAELARRFCALAGFEPDLTHQVHNLNVVQALVAAGLGVALVPDLIRPHPGPRLIPVTLVHLSRHMLAVTRAGHANLPATALVVRLVAERAQAHLREVEAVRQTDIPVVGYSRSNGSAALGAGVSGRAP